MLLGSIRSISWNSLYRDEEENQTSNDTNLGVPDDIPLLGFLAAWSDAQNKQPDNWRYASSLSIPPPAFPGFFPPSSSCKSSVCPEHIVGLMTKDTQARRSIPRPLFPGQRNKQRKNCNAHRPSAPSCPASTYFPHHLPALHVCCVIERDWRAAERAG